MIRLEETITVPQTLEDAFHYVSDFSNLMEWDPGIAASRALSPNPAGLGSSYRVVARFLGSRVPMRYHVTVHDPPHRVVLQGRGATVDAIDEIRFESVPEGTCIQYTAKLAFRGVLGLLEPLSLPLMRRVGQRALAGLRDKMLDRAGSARDETRLTGAALSNA